ncbi:hypothetical protein [Streptomyces sp. NPDC001657]|uniref:hypothetical protein n=1 Tax=Streptomyces sp. NPDC001657 TaxID=3154522 RepID=UPI00332ADA82
MRSRVRRNCTGIFTNILRNGFADPNSGAVLGPSLPTLVPAVLKAIPVGHTATEVWRALLPQSGYDLDYTGAVFDGGDFSGAEFSRGEVRFDHATFADGDVQFDDATFSGATVSFLDAVFSGSAAFPGSKVGFEGTVMFDRATFFGGEVMFDRAMFSGSEVSFHRAKFDGGVIDMRNAGGQRFPYFADSVLTAPPEGLLLPDRPPNTS